MRHAASENGDHDNRLDEVIGAYLTELDAGSAPDRDEWLRRHPDLAVELRAFLDNLDRADSWTEELRRAGVAALGDALAGPPAGVLSGATGGLVGDYELLEVIGHGGMGVVYKARQRSLNRVVALKMIRAGQLASAADRQRFRNEAEIAATLDHPHTVPIYEVGEH